jgi:hypothetical protein
VARGKLPDPLERRHWVERGLPEAQAQRVADAYLAEGRSLEALDFLASAGAEEALAGVRRDAIEAGDSFLLRAAVSASGHAATREEWLELAGAAEAAGKLRYAEDARRQAERGEE